MMMYRVVLVDDEVLIREAMKNSIPWNRLGYDLIAVCENGKEAVSVLQKERVDLVITDICMPFMDGMELSKYIYENHPATDVLILSGYDDFSFAKQAVKYKVEEYLLKPVTAAEMSETLRELKKKLDKKHEQTEEYRQMKSAMRKNQNVIRSNVLMHLMEFSMPAAELLSELAANHIQLDRDYYRVAVVAMDMFEYVLEEDREKSTLMSFVSFNVADEIVREYDAGIVFQGTQSQTVILFGTDHPKKFQNTVMEICRRISFEIKKAADLTVSIGIGTYVRGWKDIHISYTESRNALTYRYLMGGGQIIDMQTVEAGSGQLPRLTEDIEALVMHIRTNHQAGIRETLERIQTSMQVFPIEKQRVAFTLLQLVQTIQRELESTDMFTPKMIEREEQYLQMLPNFQRFDDAIQGLIIFYSEVAVELELARNRSVRKPVLMAMDYLKKHYDDPDLTLQAMCSYLAISPSRFSTIFKDATGETFVSVLTDIRMSHARKLLEQTNLKSGEVAEKVGYSDPHYFSICFKKATGMSPTEYAKEKRGTS